MEPFGPLEDTTSTNSTLVFLCGPPAVGKMAVGLELSTLTGIPLFHNHLSIEAVLPVFGFGTEPFNRLVSEFRDRMFIEVAESALPGLIFTYVWAFNEPGDLQFVERVKSIYESRNGRAVFVELWADVQTRLARNETELRLAAKPSKRDVPLDRQHAAIPEGRRRGNRRSLFTSPRCWAGNSPGTMRPFRAAAT